MISVAQDQSAVLRSEIQIRALLATERGRWDEFVEAHASGTFFHKAAWQDVIERAFGHDTHYFYAEADNRIEAVLPLAHIRSRLFGNALISLPFCAYGGVLATNENARLALEHAACALAEQLGVEYLELRYLQPSNPGWPTKNLYVTFRRALSPDPEQNFKEIPRKQRAMIRKGIEAGLVAGHDEDIDRFYVTYSTSVRNLGTPVFARRYFKLLKEVFGDACEVLTVTRSGAAVASVMSFYFRDEVLPYYGGGNAAARDLKANDFMYWDLMRRATDRGIRVFDFGRSKIDSGSYHFKKHWGFMPAPLAYEYRLVKAKTIPNISPVNPKYRYFIESWKRLPLPVTRWLGPALARNLG
ncbi:MAG: FemAB family XrtA/PEP-CTERM system-associated protein [Gammaproteobacteria bacterium]